ncbi:DUF7093 family protein [Halomontanus rarus]|uniref:DUF7093 family protein n=1 Tax=Halomontanus rarus TaxID=3034020 RepID=UPI0023E8BECB|nr:hypothetical protein [Halovivax sp. TS33]
MVLRCSLLGHDYGEPEVEREREERGSEVVVSVEEYEECARCGERNVLSENTEVTSLPPESETSGSASTSTSPSTEPETAAVPNEPSADGRDDPPSPESGSAVDAGANDGGPDPDPDSDLESDPDHPTDENGDPITDDAEILEDDDEDESRDPERERGEWPDSDDVGPPVGAENEPTAWPETDADADADEGSLDVDDEVGETGAQSPPGSRSNPAQIGESDSETTLEFDASTEDSTESNSDSGPEHDTATPDPTDDAVFVDADPEADASRPAADTDTGVGAEPDAGPGSDSVSNPETGITSAQSAPAPGEGSSAPDGVPSEFYCPRCEFVAPGDRGSLRAGDICPDCRKGYLGERER